jgi:hypothetical protein
MLRTYLLFFFILYILVPNINAQIIFEEISLINGLSFDYQEALKMGGGAATFDYDNDGDEDIYVVGGQNPDALFENDGNGHFSDVSITTNIKALTEFSTTTSVVTGDIDNDGFREIFLGTIGDIGTAFEAIQANILLKYDNSTGTFQNITQESKITNESFCMGGHFFDSNLDGYLDLYLINYVAIPNLLLDETGVIGFDHECYENNLYINNGDGTFSDMSDFYGLNQAACTLAATSSDLDWDGDPDIIVANDFGKWLEPNQLFQNEGEGFSFSNVSQSSNTNAKMYGMGIAVGDYDEDLDMDFYVTNIGPNFFFENSGDMHFTDIAELKGVQNSTSENGLNTTGWGAIFEDFNNDTYLDLFVSNGYVYSAVDIDAINQNDELFLGGADHSFNKVSTQSGIEFYGPSRGALKGDWNLDGRIDLITITNENLTSEAQNSINFYNNVAANNNWIGFNLTGTISNYDAYGAKVLLHTNDRTFLREVKGGDSHASQSSTNIHFGLKEIQEVDSIIIYWPSGIKEVLQDFDINTYHNILEGNNTSIAESDHSLNGVSIYPNPTNTFINIDMGNSNNLPYLIRLFNTNGMLILEEEIYQSKQKIEINNFARGLYNLIIYSGSKTITKSISLNTP